MTSTPAPGARPAWAAVVVAGAGALTVASGFPVGVVVSVIAVVGATAQLLGRRGFPAGEERVWGYVLAGVLVIGLSTLAGEVIEALSGVTTGEDVGSLVFAVGNLLAAPLFYHGLIHWNRVKTDKVGPDDRLNGLSGTLIAAALGNAVLPESVLPSSGLVAWQHQAALCALAGGVVLTGTALTLSFLSGLRSDRRLWLLIAAMAGLMGAPAVVLLPGVDGGGGTEAITMVAMSLIPVAAATRRPRISMVGASAQATTRGSLVVMFVAVAVLVTAGGLNDHAHRLVTAYAGVGVLLVGARLLTLIRDLEQLSETKRQAVTDDLTGIGNRRALMAALRRRVVAGTGGSLLLLDLDDFKRINDRYGHSAGDGVLLEVADLLVRMAPAGADVCRLGGDEFAVVVPGGPDDGALRLGRAFVDASSRIVDPDGRVLRITSSVGLTVLTGARRPADDDGGLPAATELLRQADVAMYRAKADRSGLAVYDPELDAQVQQEILLLDDLYDTLEDDAPDDADPIEAFFQPQIDAATHAVVGAEALARWNHPRHGLLAPDEWLPLAERRGLIRQVTVRMLRQAGREWRWANDHGYPIRMSVNLSASCLTEPRLIPELDRLVDEGVDPAALVLEITETALMSDPDLALDRMWAVRERGFGISIDDYGTGFSSLSYLRDLPATELKIDRSFVERLVGDDRTQRIVAATADLAHGLGMRLVGEGVEDEETLALLRELGCDETQGYLHGRPMPVPEFRAWLLRQHPLVPARPPSPAPVQLVAEPPSRLG